MNNFKVQPFLLVVFTIILQLFLCCPLLTVSCYSIAQSDEPAMMAVAPNVIMGKSGNDVAEEEENRGIVADELERANFNLATLAGAYDKKSLTSSNSDLSSDKFLAQSGGYLQHNSGRINFTPFILRKRQQKSPVDMQMPEKLQFAILYRMLKNVM